MRRKTLIDRRVQCPIIAVIVVLCHVFWLRYAGFFQNRSSPREPERGPNVRAPHAVPHHAWAARRSCETLRSGVQNVTFAVPTPRLIPSVSLHVAVRRV